MHLQTLRLRNFRLFEDLFLEFSKEINHFIGNNAQGKTTVLEALYFLSHGKSFRTHHIQDLVRLGQDHFSLELSFVKHGIDQQLKVLFHKGQIQIFLNDTKISKLQGLLGILHGVVITVEDVDMIKNGPQERRELLDLFLYSIDPLYYYHHQRYKKALKHRNALLKMRSYNTLAAFEAQLATSGAYLIKKRAHVTEELETICQPIFTDLSNQKDHCSLHYQTKYDPTQSLLQLEEALKKDYEENRSKDKEMYITTIGPHRDDVLFEINEQPARLFGSEGQKRTLCNAIRIGQYQTYCRDHEHAFLCIDDVKMSLDENRHFSLLQTLESYGQTFLTSPELHEKFDGKVFHLEDKQLQTST